MNQTKKTITEEDVLKALKYPHPENIVKLNVPVRVCGGKQEEVYGHFYLTKVGVRDLESAIQNEGRGREDRECIRYYSLFFRDDLPPNFPKLKNLERAIKQHPNDFDPNGKSSILSVFRYCDIMKVYGDRVIAILCNQMITDPFGAWTQIQTTYIDLRDKPNTSYIG